MKKIYLILLIAFGAFNSYAQNVKPYLILLKTLDGKFKGVLQKVDSSSVILNQEGNFIKVAFAQIKSARIRGIKKSYKTIDLFKIGSDPQEYVPNESGKMVDKWGHEMPSAEDELATTFFSAIATALANGLALPIHAINPNLAKFRFKGEKIEQDELRQLSYYSIYYQTNPNVLAELKVLKALSAGFKP